jgi:hypothetical protein
MSPRTTEKRALDSLRERAGLNSPVQEEDVAPPAERRFPLTPGQTLMLALFLIVDVCVLGVLYLLVTARLSLPF